MGLPGPLGLDLGVYESQGSLPGGGLEALMGSDVPFWDSGTIMLGYQYMLGHYEQTFRQGHVYW